MYENLVLIIIKPGLVTNACNHHAAETEAEGLATSSRAAWASHQHPLSEQKIILSNYYINNNLKKTKDS